MKHSKLTALLCALVMTGAGSMSAFAADAAPAAAAATAAQPAKAQETTAAAGTPAEAAQPEVNYTEALLKGMSLTLPDVEKAVEAGTFKNLLRKRRNRLNQNRLLPRNPFLNLSPHQLLNRSRNPIPHRHRRRLPSTRLIREQAQQRLKQTALMMLRLIRLQPLTRMHFAFPTLT